tara:strand:+ start:1914 stop:5333 length:3420 start_codon:yes stop_codon:yes gene_type:complete
MPEIKNNFLRSKMNKDLDARLIPNGEYRDAQNISVSRSEGADVGALENILGNTKITSLKSKIESLEIQKALDLYGANVRPNELLLSGLEIIGYFMDISRDSIYLFLTDYTDSSNDQLSNFAPSDSVDTTILPNIWRYKGAACYIVRYNVTNSSSKVLVAGNFLNFSKTHPIISVNILENLLFWTDDRNQPRKINVDFAFNNSYEDSAGSNPYYYNEDHISVAKFAPYETFSFIDSSNNSTLISNHEQFLPAHIVTKIKAQQGVTGNTVIIAGEYTTSGSNRDLIQNDRIRIIVDDTDYYYTVNAASYNSSTNQTEITIQESQFGVIINVGDIVTISRTNPDYNTSYKGDTNILRDKFAKFSYRFKYDDNEYSLMSPFTQSAFVPKQFGYFINDDEEVASEATDVKFMENRVDQVKLNLTLPCNASQLQDKLKVKEIQILVKNSDEQAVRVIEDIDISKITSLGPTTKYEYNYLSTKPIKALPEAELIRVHDKVPVRALTQEVVGNRVIYGNFLDKHSSPDNLDYDLDYIQKPQNDNFTIEFPTHTVKQNRSYQVGIVLVDRYGRASNVILNDLTSGLTQNKNSTIYAGYNNFGSAWNSFFGNQLELNVRSKIPSSLSKPGYPGLYSETNPLGYYTYRIVVKQQEQDYYNVYVPGALAGRLLWDTKPDWKSSGTVDFTADVLLNINDYLPYFIQENRISMINIFGDNINKVPRELKTSSNANDTTFGSETKLFNRVNPIYDGTDSYNTQSTVSASGEKVISIEPFKDLGAWTTTKGNGFPFKSPNTSIPPQPYYPYFASQEGGSVIKLHFHDIFFNSQSNPFIATIETDFKIGATPEYRNTPQNTDVLKADAKLKIERAWQDLGVFETSPTKSVIDIYWESSTSGLISDYNNEVPAAGLPAGVKDTAGNNTAEGDDIEYFHNESDVSGTLVTNNLSLVDSTGNDITNPYTLTLNTVVDGNGNDRTSEFNLVPSSGGTHRIETNSTFMFGSNANVEETYTFNLLASDIFFIGQTPDYLNVPVQITNCRLQNTAPSWRHQIGNSFIAPGASPPYLLAATIEEGDVLNGSADINRNREDLFYTVHNSDGTINNNFEVVQDGSFFNVNGKNTISSGSYTIKIKAIDAGGYGLSTFSNTFVVGVM